MPRDGIGRDCRLDGLSVAHKQIYLCTKLLDDRLAAGDFVSSNGGRLLVGARYIHGGLLHAQLQEKTAVIGFFRPTIKIGTHVLILDLFDARIAGRNFDGDTQSHTYGGRCSAVIRVYQKSVGQAADLLVAVVLCKDDLDAQRRNCIAGLSRLAGTSWFFLFLRPQTRDAEYENREQHCKNSLFHGTLLFKSSPRTTILFSHPENATPRSRPRAVSYRWAKFQAVKPVTHARFFRTAARTEHLLRRCPAEHWLAMRRWLFSARPELTLKHP